MMYVSDVIVDKIYWEIVQHKKQFDGNIPSFRDLAKTIGVSVTTVSNAIPILEEKELVTVVRENGRVKMVLINGGRWEMENVF